MQQIIGPFRLYLRSILEAEKSAAGLTMGEMLDRLKNSKRLPDFYAIPANKRATEMMKDHAAANHSGQLSEELSEAIKAVYGEWMREGYRGV